MKKLIILIGLAIFLIGERVAIAQTSSCEIPLMIISSKQEEALPRATMNQLANKLTRIATTYGLAANNDYAQFVISPKFSVLEKSILPGPPRSFVYNFELTLFIGDYFGQKIFNTTSINIKGIGENENKAYINAIKQINPKSEDLQNFILDAKDKIIAYYNANYPSIIKKAQSLASQKQFEESMFLLMAIPDCSQGYDKALEVAATVYQSYVDDQCNQYLAQAKMAWASQQNSDGAEIAVGYLANIYPEAKCYGDAMDLYKEIKTKVKEDWNFVMKIYNDSIDLKKQQINAWKDVGVAYGKGQKSTSTQVYWGR